LIGRSMVAAFFLPFGLADVGFVVDVASGTDATGSLETGITTCSFVLPLHCMGLDHLNPGSRLSLL
jgi:hypothetical protein